MMNDDERGRSVKMPKKRPLSIVLHGAVMYLKMYQSDNIIGPVYSLITKHLKK